MSNPDDRTAAWLYDRLTDACVQPPGMGHLENPQLADDLIVRWSYGSNFPIEKLWTDYGTLYRTFRNAIAHLSDAEQAAILHDTASRLYRI